MLTCYLVTSNHPENQGSYVLVQNTLPFRWLFLDKWLYSFHLRFIPDIVIMQIYFPSQSQIYLEQSTFPFPAFSAQTVSRSKLHSDTLKVVYQGLGHLGCK